MVELHFRLEPQQPRWRATLETILKLILGIEVGGLVLIIHVMVYVGLVPFLMWQGWDKGSIFTAIQDAILVEIGVIAFWYANETYLQRVAFNKQVKISQTTLNLAKKEYELLLTPYFILSGGSYDQRAVHVFMENLGSAVSEEVVTADGLNGVTCIYDNAESKNRIIIPNVPRPESEITLRISYKDRFARKGEAVFVRKWNNNKPTIEVAKPPTLLVEIS